MFFLKLCKRCTRLLGFKLHKGGFSHLDGRGLGQGLGSLVSEEFGVFVFLFFFLIFIFIIAEPIVIFASSITALADSLVSCTLILKLCSLLFHIASVLSFSKLGGGSLSYLRCCPRPSLVTWRKGTGSKPLLRRCLTDWASLLRESCWVPLLCLLIVVLVILLHVVLLLVILLILLLRKSCRTRPYHLPPDRIMMSLVMRGVRTSVMMVRGDLLLWLRL